MVTRLPSSFSSPAPSPALPRVTEYDFKEEEEEDGNSILYQLAFLTGLWPVSKIVPAGG